MQNNKRKCKHYWKRQTLDNNGTRTPHISVFPLYDSKKTRIVFASYEIWLEPTVTANSYESLDWNIQGCCFPYQILHMAYTSLSWYYEDFLDRGLLLTRKLLKQGFLLVNLKSSLRKFYGHHHDLVNRYGTSVSQMTTDMLHLSWTLPGPFLIQDLLPGI